MTFMSDIEHEPRINTSSIHCTRHTSRRPPNPCGAEEHDYRLSPISMAATSRLELKATTKIIPFHAS